MGARSLSRLCGQLEKVSEADFLEHRFVYLQKMEQEAATAVDALNSDAYFTPNGITAQAGSSAEGRAADCVSNNQKCPLRVRPHLCNRLF